MGLLLKVLAAVVYLQFVATQVYDPLLAGVGLEIWRILDPLMVLGLAVALVNSYHRKRQVVSVADDGVTREYLVANCVFYFGRCAHGLLAVELDRLSVVESLECAARTVDGH